MNAPTANLDPRVHSIGKEIFARLSRRGPFPFSRRWFDDKLMNVTMEHPALKVQLFRFVDTLPYLHEPADVSRHLREYLNEAADDLPWWARAGRKLIPQRGLGSKLLARSAKKNAEGMARKFIAGSNVPEAIAAVRKMREDGLTFTIDLLGEATITEAEADHVQQQYFDLLNGLCAEANTWP